MATWQNLSLYREFYVWARHQSTLRAVDPVHAGMPVLLANFSEHENET